MATDVERLRLELSADVSRLERGLRQGTAATLRATRAIESQFERMNQRTTRSVSMMTTSISGSIAGLALGLAAREVAQYADAWTRATNSIRAQGNTLEETNARMQELVDISLRSRSELSSTVTLYNRLTASSQALGVSQTQVARVVETVNKALATSNMTAGERASAVTQLAQGLGSGTLAGDELKAIRENSIVIAQAIADEFGVTIGELKKLGSEGELTSVRVFAAIEKASGKVDAAFGRTRATIDDALTNLQTKTIAFIGSLDASTGASAKFGQIVEFVANNLDEIATAATVAAAAVGGGYAVAMTVAATRTVAATVSSVAYQVALMRLAARQTGATVAQVALNAALTANPIGLVIVAVAALAGGLAYLALRQTDAAVAARANKQALEDAAPATSKLDGLIRQLANANDVETASIRRKIAALIDEQRVKAQGARNRYLEAKAAEQARGVVRDQIQANPMLSSGGIPAGGLRFDRGRSGVPSNRTVIGPNGNPIDTVPMTAELRRLRAEAEAADASVQRLQDTVDEATAVRTPTPIATDDKAGKKASGPTAAELAAMREQLALEGQLAIAQANANEAEEKRLQRILDIRSLTEQLTRAQVANAEQVATTQVDAILAGEATQKLIDDLIAASERRTSARIEAEAALTAEMDRQLETQLALARIEGNEAVILMLERELQLRQALAALGPNATPEQRAAVRGDEAMLNRAEDRAMLAEEGKEMARSFLGIISAADAWTEAGNRFRQAAFDNLEAVLGNIFAQIMGGNAQGGGMGGTVANVLGSLFGGNRALSGPVSAGRAYKVNENTPNSEYFVPKSDGWVGNMKPAKAQASRGPVQMTFRTEYNLQGAAGTEAILGTVQRMQAASERRILTTVQAAAPNAQLEQQLLKG